jgi:teichuronic acid biosynthesis glycosyltransferase TuaC
MKKILAASINYPDAFNLWAPWNKEANVAISKVKDITLEVLSPRPFTLPFHWFKYHYFSSIPLTEQGIEGKIHHPRFPYLLPKKIFYPLAGGFYSLFVGGYVKKNIPDIDLIHSHHAYPDGFGLAKVCRKLHCPLVIDIHGSGFFSDWLKQPLLQKKIWNCVNNSSKIICISKKLLSDAVAGGIPEQKLVYIPLGIDVNRFEKSCISDFSPHLNHKHENQLILLSVGHLNTGKGITYLIQAISYLPSDLIKKCHFIIVGDGPEKANLINQSASLKISDSVTFTGRLVGDNLLGLYSYADVFILPSLSEGRPTVINEAMVSGCAIIASNIDGVPEQVIDGYNGFLVEPGNPRQLANKIRQLVEDENLIRIMGKNSKKKIFDEGITWENYAKKVEKVYTDVINE